MKILLPIDFSAAGTNALRFVASDLLIDQLHVLLYHCFIPLQSGFYSRLHGEEENCQEEQRLRANLQRLAKKLQGLRPDATTEVYVDRGVARKNLLRFAQNNQVELIVMGTTGATGLKEKLLGSLTADILANSHCPVIAVPQRYRPRIIKKVVFCSGYQWEDVEAIKTLITLFPSADIEIVHVEEPKSSSSRHSQPLMQEEYQKMIRRRFRGKNVRFHVLYYDDVQQSLERLARRKETELIAMVTFPRKGFLQRLLKASMARTIAYHTRVPLFSFPAAQNR